MYNVKKITDDLFWVGGNDRRLALFENVYPIPEGISYNSYVLMDEKTVLLDTADSAIMELFTENVKAVLNGRKLDYIIVNHMEPDHSASLMRIAELYPEARIVTSAKAKTMMGQFFDFDMDRVDVVKEGDTLTTGRHTLTFVAAPMVHWPEVIFTFDQTDGTLFSADAFGTFGALNGNLFADEVNFETEWLASARRYYTNIVGKYGPQVQKVLEKAGGLNIRRICPLHGPVWRENIGWFIDRYQHWATCTPEDKGVVIFVGSIYGHTQNAADVLASAIADEGIHNVKVYDVSVTDASYLLAEAFRASHLVFASATYNNEIFTNMEHFLMELKEHAFHSRTVAVMENGTWAPQSGKKIRAMLEEMKDMTVLDQTVTFKSAPKEAQRADILALAKAVADAVKAS
ncbi:MAG: FprA family A-type flavoprotein [Eubacteriales bacterium]|jgi:flavorubredoxin